MSLSVNDRILIEQRVGNDGPNMAVAYILWIFLGWLSGHRFYLGRWKSALLQIVLIFLVVGLVWLFIDLFLIPRMVRDIQDRMRHQLAGRMLAG